MSRIFVLGANGVLGRNLLQTFSKNSDQICVGVSRDIIQNYTESSLKRYFYDIDKCTILNCIGVLPDIAESQPDLSYFANFQVVESVVKLLISNPQFSFVQMSTSLVFDGQKGEPYVETDATSPISTYGRHKVLAENLILDNIPNQSTICRFGSLVTPNILDNTTFNKFLIAIRDRSSVIVESDRRISIADPTLIAQALNSEIVKSKIVHITHSTPSSWLDVVEFLNSYLGSRSNITTSPYFYEARGPVSYVKRPRNTSLASDIQINWQQVSWKEIVMRNLPA